MESGQNKRQLSPALRQRIIDGSEPAACELVEAKIHRRDYGILAHRYHERVGAARFLEETIPALGAERAAILARLRQADDGNEELVTATESLRGTTTDRTFAIISNQVATATGLSAAAARETAKTEIADLDFRIRVEGDAARATLVQTADTALRDRLNSLLAERSRIGQRQAVRQQSGDCEAAYAAQLDVCERLAIATPTPRAETALRAEYGAALSRLDELAVKVATRTTAIASEQKDSARLERLNAEISAAQAAVFDPQNMDWAL